MINGEGDRKYSCFRYECLKPDCMGTKNCKFDKKADRSEVNNQEAIKGKFKELKEEMKHRKSSGTIGGSTYVIESTIVPS